MDFGLIKVAARGDPSRTVIRGSGTPGFAPLEQYGRQGGTDARADLYALGCCLYVLATATLPSEAPDRAANPRLLRPVRALNPGAAPELAQAIERAMALHAGDRYQSATELRRALDRSGRLHVSEGAACLRCGASFASGQKFCPRCGAAVGQAQSLPPAALLALIGAALGVGLALTPWLASPNHDTARSIAVTVGCILFACEGATAGALVGYRVSPTRLLFFPQALRLGMAALAGEAILAVLTVLWYQQAHPALSPMAVSALVAGVGACLGVLALLGAPGVRRAWPR